MLRLRYGTWRYVYNWVPRMVTNLDERTAGMGLHVSRVEDPDEIAARELKVMAPLPEREVCG